MRLRLRPAALPAIAALACCCAGPTAGAAQPGVSYNRDVQPILSDKCFFCHGPDAGARQADLRLDARDDAISAGAIKPGDAAGSPLIQRIIDPDPRVMMPPPRSHKKLSDAEKQLLTQWIDEGAEYQVHWAYTPLQRPLLPAVEGRPAAGPIDAFIRQRLTEKGVDPSPAADRATLLRRLKLDLLGLPPSYEEAAAFAASESPDAYAAEVERLLASPHYGERMAQRWLDTARYADTVGYHGDQNQNAWPYRDYVIKSFNDNKPFDRFTREQLAGDLLPDPTDDERSATCFNRLNMMTREGGAQPKEYLAKYNADRVRTVSTTWLGSTFGCAECHDHKFDPIKQKDFYSLAAFFADVKQWGVYADYGYTPNPDLRGYNNDYPFPPEIVVESPTLMRRLKQADEQIAALCQQQDLATPAAQAWREALGAFLDRCPTGWETPTPAIDAGKGGAQSQEVDQDLAVVRGEKSPDPLIVRLHPTERRLAAVRVELLPHAKHAGLIVRKGGRGDMRVDLLVAGDKGERRVGVRHAAADRSAPRYSNSFEIIGVQSGWKLQPDALDQPHSATFVLDQPLVLAEGETLSVKLTGGAGAVRLSCSPIAPPDIRASGMPANLREQLKDDTIAANLYLRSAGGGDSADARAAYQRLKAIDARILAMRDGRSPVMVTERTDKPMTIRLLNRGDWQDDGGEICPPTLPGFLPSPVQAEGLSRLDLAQWLCAPENPLTARVFVNRLWQQFFGAGLSPQIDDLGAQGEAPSHPELLDWLACEFRDSGWDVKHVVRLIVTSDTYRQSSQLRPELIERDPHNRWLASQNPRRLDAEFVRDNALAIAGLINLEVGGPPAMPYQPEGYYAGLQFPNRGYDTETDNRQYRRGVYMHWQRTFLHPELVNFDAPSREDCTALRTISNSPQQALTLLNDPTFVECARVLAGELLTSHDASDGQRVAECFKRAVARTPSQDEAAGLLALLTKARQRYANHPDEAAALIAIGIAPRPAGIDAAELAAWTNVARVVLNLHETITRY
ncbi:Planctomycete cytochrome C [Pirellulimonas nuda]|uniref:Planctomycete cytochrome C n=1 Tax=Pirellulimonas nuda TaxID=2528009 RepID=A0A518D6Q1_9BACT|nr:PSD1 and planctomycete cytochrome C domain-containing protein [Pirellulimonas nuda]QDU87136.1 Planctomycete cytochrome C [Pirellulimonas nuda]